MFIATLIVSLLLALALLSSASGKLTKKPAVIEQITAVGVPADKIPLLGYLEIAGALGLIAGLFWWPIGVAAAIGVILYFLGAVISHLRVKDVKGSAPAAALALVAVAALVLRLLSI
ncbi:DoxX family protein [Gordonia rubripertincta]|uniref:DoxX family protein n=1 Tax=Gordonia rubripertincta TaxID=36822 RepID=UPI000B8D6CB5|nr:DoxX family protein [Gordonia rubripertincta]ASR01761.1 hypothetical protein GCWB2_04675 [Gordonia rubripertincta]ASR05654.1 hypothetical protein GCWB2_24415 [Gordonia rubripertincta]